MCGLVSVISKSGNNGLWKEQCEMFHELLMVDTLRGEDSTGMFLVDKDGDLELAKSACDAPSFQKTKTYDELMRKAFGSGRLVVGHNRKATKGTVTDMNAHPFVVDDRIILVHNGTLWGDYQKLAGADNKVEVDSHAIAHLIHKHGDDVEKALSELNGAFALIWFDMEKQTLNFVRNSQRPLYWMETSSSYIWASEKNFLDWMVSRHNIFNAKIHDLPPNTLTTFTIKPHSVSVDSVKLDLSTKTTTTTSCGPNDNWYEGVSCDVTGQDYRRFASAHYPVDDDDETFIIGNPQQKDDRTALREALKDMEEREGIGRQTLVTPFEEASKRIVQGVNKPRFRAVSAEVTKTIRAEEEERAFRFDSATSALRFNNAVANIRDGENYRAQCFDYAYVNGKDGKNGFLLYGLLHDTDQIIIRAYMAPEYPELSLVDLTTNKRDAAFKVNGKSWRSFDLKSHQSEHGDGFGMVLAITATRYELTVMKETVKG